MTEKIAYFVQDLADPAVHRRVRMLLAGGATVTPIGFRRGAEPITAMEGVAAFEIGRSADGRLLKRVLSIVAAAAVKLSTVERHVRGSDVIIARNLEMLVLATQARKRYAPQATLVYECLDIHRMLLSEGLDGSLLRSLESRLWRNVDLLLTSSPAFVRNYFGPRKFPAPIKLTENKLVNLNEAPLIVPLERAGGPPWRIGWFGMIRCRRSLDILSSLARAAEGALEVIIRGRPSGSVFPDFETVVANRPHVRYAGPYRNPGDLRSIYGDVHFTWAIDYYESGQNSAWLLPNRLYEGGFYGAVPIAMANVETGAWLTERRVGVVLNEPLQEGLRDFFRSLTPRSYTGLSQTVAALPRKDLLSDRSECLALVRELCHAPIERQIYPPGEVNSIGISSSRRLGAQR